MWPFESGTLHAACLGSEPRGFGQEGGSASGTAPAATQSSSRGSGLAPPARGGRASGPGGAPPSARARGASCSGGFLLAERTETGPSPSPQRRALEAAPWAAWPLAASSFCQHSWTVGGRVSSVLRGGDFTITKPMQGAPPPPVAAGASDGSRAQARGGVLFFLLPVILTLGEF